MYVYIYVSQMIADLVLWITSKNIHILYLQIFVHVARIEQSTFF